MTSYILNIILQLIECLICYSFYENITNVDKKYLKRLSVMVISYIGMWAVNLLFNYNVVINTVVMVAFHIVFAYFLYKQSIRFSAVYSVLITSLVTITELIVINLIALAFHTDVYSFIENTFNYVLLIVFSKTLLFIILKIIGDIINNHKSGKKVNLIFLLYPFSLLVALTVFGVISREYDLSERNKWIMSFSILFLTFSVVLTCFFQQESSNKETELAELKTMQLKNEIDIQYLDLLEKKNQQMQILAHDYKNHLAAIRELGDNEQVAEYIDKMTSEIKASNSTCHSGNHTLDIIINKYVTECEIKHIKFEFDTKLSNLGFVDDFDLVTILGNLLDNALEAAQQSEGKHILLKTKRVNTYDAVVISNSCDTAPDKNLKTSKEKDNHGLGLKSVSKTVKKYGGDFDWEYNEIDKEFIITIMLLSKEG